MRVTFVQFTGKYFGGVARCLAEFAVELSRLAQVSVVDPGGGGPDFVEAIKGSDVEYHARIAQTQLPAIGSSTRLVGRSLGLVKALPRFMEVRKWTIGQVSRLAPDVMCSFDFRSAFVVGTSWNLRSVPLVIQLHGWYIPPYITSYGRWLMRNRAALVVAISHQTRTALRCAGCAPSKLIVIQNPVDVEAISSESQRPLHKELPGQDAKVRILLPAQFSYGKGQRVAVEALAILRDRGLDAFLWLAGVKASGPGEKPYIEQTEDAARRLGVAERVVWLGHRDDIPQIMRASTVVILPSITEGHPRVVLEAMALGKPVVATPVGGVLDMIIPQLTGMLFEVGDAKGLALCLEQLATDPALAERVSSLGQLHARINFDPERHVQMLLQAFERAISGDSDEWHEDKR